uniref:Uncharacterized protein n=1 Tax=Romanomermis culicivorax TaxID=13658 RepID=A0A915K3R9_ROMCU
DYLDPKGVANPAFVDNYPGNDWCLNFLNHHKAFLSTRLANNIKRARANVGPKVMKKYFENLEVTVVNVKPENIHNHEETNLSDGPGRKKGQAFVPNLDKFIFEIEHSIDFRMGEEIDNLFVIRKMKFRKE